MSQNETTTQTETIHIPKFAYPFEEKICAIADGELVAYRINSDYLKNDSCNIWDSLLEMGKGLYSTGFFLIRHKLEYPKDNKLTFFSLYMHTAKKDIYTKDKPFIIKDFVSDKVEILKTPKPISAGEVIGLMGEYNQQKESDKKVLHLEVFTSEDIKKFMETAKKGYKEDTSKDKPKPKSLEIAKDSKKYKLQSSTKVKLKKNSNIREGFSNTSAIYQGSATPIGTIVIIDKNIKREVEQHTRYKVLKIGETDVSSQNLTIAKITFKTIEDINNFVEDGKISEKLYAKALEEVSNNGKDYVKIGDNEYVEKINCKQNHPITFEWARIFEMNSKDHISIFDDMKNYILPDKHQTDELKINESFQELFKMIDTDHKNGMDAQEISEATQNIEIKKITNKYIVKHSSEWDKKENMAKKLYEIIDEHKDKLDGVDELLKHYENEKERIENLSFFEECKNIDGFPKDDMVYVINPIGLIGAFGVEDDCATRFKKISKIVLKNEGGFVDSGSDIGGATNHGIAWNTWQSYAQSDLGLAPTRDNLKNLSEENAEKIYLKRYWEPKGFCKIKDIRVALMIYDWSITSGGAIKEIQKLLNSSSYNYNLTLDGTMGNKTISAINGILDQNLLFNDIGTIRKEYYHKLAFNSDGSHRVIMGKDQALNYDGWINRVDIVLGVQL